MTKVDIEIPEYPIPRLHSCFIFSHSVFDFQMLTDSGYGYMIAIQCPILKGKFEARKH